MGMKPPLQEPHGAIRNASNNPSKRAHNAPIKNQNLPQVGTERPTESYIRNESDPQGGKRPRKR